MDVGLITAGPATDAAIGIQSPGSRSTTGVSSSPDTTQDGSSTNSFADALQQSSDAQSRTSTAVAVSTDPGNSASAAKANQSGDPTIGLPTIGGAILSGPGEAMQGAPLVPVHTPVVLQGTKASAKPSAQLVSGAGAASPGKSNIRKNSLGSETANTAASGDAPDNPAIGSVSSASASTIPTTVPLPNDLQQVVAAPKSDVLGSDKPHSVPKPSGLTTKSVQSAATSQGGTADTSGVMTSSTAGQDAVAPVGSLHGDAAAALSGHVTVSVDSTMNTIGSAGAATTSVVPVLPSMSHAETPASSSTVSVMSPHADAMQFDASSGSGSAHTMLVATPNVLEVGLSSGAHGWVRVRAEMSTEGDVSASVRGASETAYESLHKELPSISAYLANERVGLTSLSVEHSVATSNAGAGLGQSGLDYRAGGGAGAQPGGRGGATDAAWMGAGTNSTLEDGVLNEVDFAGATLPAMTHTGASGSWLSVRA